MITWLKWNITIAANMFKNKLVNCCDEIDVLIDIIVIIVVIWFVIVNFVERSSIIVVIWILFQKFVVFIIFDDVFHVNLICTLKIFDVIKWLQWWTIRIVFVDVCLIERDLQTLWRRWQKLRFENVWKLIWIILLILIVTKLIVIELIVVELIVVVVILSLLIIVNIVLIVTTKLIKKLKISIWTILKAIIVVKTRFLSIKSILIELLWFLFVTRRFVIVELWSIIYFFDLSVVFEFIQIN